MAVKIVAKNKNAKRNFEITETYEAGMVLRGSEVKAIREGNVQIAEAYVRFDKSELWVIGMHISPYSSASSHVVIEPTRKRKLMMHKVELERLYSKSEQQSLTIVPIAIYLKAGRVKLEIGLGKGKRTVDKRQDIKKRDADREARRAMVHRSR